MIFGRPIIVWVLALIFGVPAVFFVLGHGLVLTGLISPPPHMTQYFEKLDMVYLGINGAEAIFLTGCMGCLLAMKRLAFPATTIYFAIDTLHNLSGKYTDSPRTLGGLAFIVAVNGAVVAYVWNLNRKNLLS